MSSNKQNTVRIILYKNAKNPGPGKSIDLSPNTTYKDLLSQSSKLLGDNNSEIIFNDKGQKISSIKNLPNNSSIYLSKTEEFLVSNETTETVFAVLGPAGVGKSAITFRYTRNFFVTDYDPTIEDYYRHTTVINGETHNFSILDTAGMEDYEPLLDEWIDRKQAILLVFSLDSEDSLIKIDKYYTKINQLYSNSTKPVIALIGNKADLSTKIADKARKYAEKLNIKYYEVSAATNYKIKEVFTEVLIEVKSRRNKTTKIPWYKRCFLL